MVQWLRLSAVNPGGPGLIPGQGTKSSMPPLRPGIVKKIFDSAENAVGFFSYLY